MPSSLESLAKKIIVTATPDTTAAHAAQLMRAQHVGSLIVVDPAADNGRPVGIVTDRDLVLAVMAEDMDASLFTVGDIMSADLVTAPGSADLIEALGHPGQDAPPGEPGELCISGPNVMKGYWMNEAANADSMTADGYFRTGDIAYMDADGFVHIVDRSKDMLLCGGFNVYPRLIEDAIYLHPAVAEVCVIGVPDAYRGQSPKAFVTLKPGAAAFTIDELKDFLKGHLGKHEMVQELEIRAELPKTPIGKLSKKDLADDEQRKRAAAAPG